MIFTKDYHLEMEDFVAGGKMSLYGIMKNLENTGYKHSESVGDGVFDGHEVNQAWVSIDWLLQISEYPTCGQKITMDTWSQPCSSAAIAARDFILYADGKEVVHATTRCALVNLKEGHPVRISADLLSKYQPDEKKAIDIKRLERLDVPEEFDYQKEIPLRRNDFDYNGHIHNLTYLPLALESLTDEDFAKPINTLRISYKSAIKVGTKTLVCKCKKVEGRQFIYMYTEDELRCIVVIN